MISAAKQWSYPLFRAIQSIYDYLLYLFTWKSGKGTALDTIRKRILLLRQDSVGDLVMFSASLPLYRELFKEDYLVLLVKDSGYEIAEKCPYVNEVWSLPERKLRRNFLERWRWSRKLSKARFDIAIKGAYSSSFTELDCLIGWTHAPRRIAHQCLDSIRRRDRTGPFFTELVPSDREWKFEIDRNLDLLRHLGCQGNADYKTEVWTEERDQSRTDSLKRRLGSGDYAVLIPGAKDTKRRWSPDYLVEAVTEVQRRFPMHWVVCGTSSEQELCEYVAKQLLRCSVSTSNWAGATTLREVTALIRDANCLVSNETSAVHIAAAVGTPTVCILGGGHYGRFYPYPNNPLTIAVTNKLPCYNCHWRCILDEEECVTKIRVKDVVKAVAGILARSPELAGHNHRIDEMGHR
jgi:ADP-heptose:LPS heptosyltransferase